MSNFERYMARTCKHTAVYWAYLSTDEFGVKEYDQPVDIKCFWKEEIKLIQDMHGNETVSTATVYVLQDLTDHGMLFQGTLDDLTSAERNDVRQVDKAFEIKRYMKTPSLRSGYNRKAYL